MALHREIKVNTDEVGLVTSRLGPAKLYLDDIQTIYDVLFKTVDKKLRIPGILKRPSVVITAGEAIADLPNDLQEATRDELREVKITLNEPLITVSRVSAGVYFVFFFRQASARLGHRYNGFRKSKGNSTQWRTPSVP